MAELLQVLESLRAEEATVQRMFQSEAREGLSSAAARRAVNSAAYLNRLANATQFYSEVLAGKRPLHHFKEAMTTSDFPNMFGDILDRQLLANYREYPSFYRNFVKIGSVSDFRTKKLYTLEGAESVLTEVPEKTEYPAAKLTESPYTYNVKKYGRRIHFSWETMVNDDLGALSDAPQRFGRAARRSEQRYVTTLYVDANGPHASVYTVGNANIVTGNPALSISALQTAMAQMAAKVDSEGEPIYIETVILVVPPALEITANNILNALQYEVVEVGGTANQKLIAQNWMRNRLQLVVDPYIPIIASSSNGSTSWFLFASPNAERPAIELGFLRGHEEPEIFMKSPNQVRINGGGMPSEDFDTDSIQYKVRHVFGGAVIDPKMTMGSQGDGS